MMRFFLVGVAFLSVFLAMHVYLYRRLVRDVTRSRRLRSLGKILIFSVLLLVPLLRILRGQFVLPHWPTFAVAVWMGLALFMVLALASVDAVAWVRRRLLGRDAIANSPEDSERRLFMARVTAVGAVALGGGFSTLGVWNAFSEPEVSDLSVRLKGLKHAMAGFSIVHLSDIHIGTLIRAPFVDRLVDVANGLRPDLVVITGDLIDGPPEELAVIARQLSKLRAPHGVFVVSGNHEFYAGWDPWVPVFTDMGFQVLRNRWVRIGGESDGFDLIGVDDWSQRNRPGGYDLAAAVAGRDPERASVLLAHQPTGLDAVTRAGIGLQLSGHTHGGQVFPATLLVKAIWGARSTGLSVHGGTSLYTSRGCGFVGPPMRVGAPPEVAVLTLEPG